MALDVTLVLSGFCHLQPLGFGVTNICDNFGFCPFLKSRTYFLEGGGFPQLAVVTPFKHEFSN